MKANQCFGEIAPTKQTGDDREVPSETHVSILTLCIAMSYPNGRDEWSPLSARPAGRERPPRKRP